MVGVLALEGRPLVPSAWWNDPDCVLELATSGIMGIWGRSVSSGRWRAWITAALPVDGPRERVAMADREAIRVKRGDRTTIAKRRQVSSDIESANSVESQDGRSGREKAIAR